ncbi:energy-coupling factor ABC transporter permease [Roseiflexus sp.]|uniref:energy-coupling factor ABC transporter permease n=1 Tax=Roseiflexus sp. TaxID=2562120 RepID=UPI0021DCC09B|nr:energy-coupling factor ABC transporter permease [Roseiflexus sp.]GIV98766.1 MAG: cobalamin biosynthesis protein CbiM [Roseiflexus sp.]
MGATTGHIPGAQWSLFGAELHIPDGFLNLPISIVCWIGAIALIAFATQRAQRTLDERQMPLMGIMAAFIFAAQMINFPVAGGTSGHLLGGVLAAVTLGPWAGILVMTAVIAVQALLFQDGGLLVMGANILNMGLITALIGYGLYRSVIHQRPAIRLAVIGVAAWLSVMGAALATSLQLWLSGTVPLEVVIPAMMSVHALIGIGEALITVAAVSFILRTRPERMATDAQRSGADRGWIIGGALAALIVVVLSPLASADPDGLERVAEDMGFIDLGQSAPYEIIPDYTVPFLGETPLSTIVAGIIGALVVTVVVVLIAQAVRSRQAGIRS